MAVDPEMLGVRTGAVDVRPDPRDRPERSGGSELPPDPARVAKRDPRSLWLHKPRLKHGVPLAAAGVVLAFAEPSPVLFALGLPLVALGLGLRVWAAGHLVKRRVLSLGGPYAHLRHPFYAGALAIAVGLLVCAGPRPALGIPLVLLLYFRSYLPRKDRRESAELVRRHGALARAYLAAVPALWPRLEPWSPPRDAAVAPRVWSPACFRENSEMGTIQAVALALVALVGAGLVG